MLPKVLTDRIHATRDLTFDREAFLWTPRKDRKTSPTGAQTEAEYDYLGAFPCRLDAQDDVQQNDGRDRRPYGFTLPNDAPKLIVGDAVKIDGLHYRVDQASDDRAEVILRRYVVSVSQEDLKLAREEC